MICDPPVSLQQFLHLGTHGVVLTTGPSPVAVRKNKRHGITDDVSSAVVERLLAPGAKWRVPLLSSLNPERVGLVRVLIKLLVPKTIPDMAARRRIFLH
jgi:hypothetical protein